MSVLRKLAAVGIGGAAAVVLAAVVADPADAHGAPTTPVSRAAACGTEGGDLARSAACAAALGVSRGQALDSWDNLRLPNVNGRDREVVPDGQLCSAGKPEFRGLDLARDDWPATRLAAGAPITFTYRGTIPHEGTFRFYVTKDGYSPTQPLRWSDLEARPFLTTTDPALRDGSYRIPGRLPAAKSGRHLIYTIWQNSSTPDTYYSCSDVVFRSTAAAAPKPANPPAPAATPAAPDAGALPGSVPVATVPGSAPAAPGTDAASGVGDAQVSLAKKSSRTRAMPWAAGGAIVLVLAVGAAVALRRRRV